MSQDSPRGASALPVPSMPGPPEVFSLSDPVGQWGREEVISSLLGQTLLAWRPTVPPLFSQVFPEP